MQRARFGIGQQQPAQFAALTGRELAVDIGVDQFDLSLVEHDQSLPCPFRASLSACRAVNSRDFTVLSGMPRISLMSS